ncbi:MAG TPA: PRC-barrel domain-containing protein [Candidatus Saccharimonadales bacterium]|nr:PRC-barrel domain-containing protein [Candidatus Saccharimonadales bacterium]
MLRLHETLLDVPVLSLRTGGQVAIATKMIINPNNLKVLGWYVNDRFSSDELILLSGDVREISSKGIIINDHEVLSEPEELVRHKEVLEVDYDLMGKKVVSESGKKYGKVTDFSVETGGMIIKKVYASQSIIKDFSGGNLSIDRNQIIEITRSKVIIKNPTEKSSATAASTVPAR